MVGLIGILAVAGCSDPVSDSSEQSYEISQPVGTLAVDARAAKVTLETGDGPVTVTEILRYSNDKPATSHTVDGDTLKLSETGCGSGVNVRCDVEYQIRVPRQTAASITTQAGPVTVRGLDGRLTVATDAGTVNGDGLTSASTVVTTKAGLVKLVYAAAPDQVTAETDVGGVEVRVPGGQSYAVDISTTVGASDVSVDRDAGSAHRISVRSKVGAVRIAPV